MSAQADLPTVEPLRVALLADDRCFQLFPSMIRHLSVGLIDEATRVTLICDQKHLPDSFASGPVRTIACPAGAWTSQRRRLAYIAAQLAAQPPMVVHALSGKLLDLAERLAELWDIPAVVNITALDEPGRRKLRNPARLHLIAPSDPLLQHIRQATDCLPEKCLLIRPAVHCSDQPGCYRDPTKLPAIMTIGRLDNRSGVAHLIRAFATLIKDQRQAMLFVIGTGPDESELRKLSDQLKLGRIITFAGRLDTPLTALRGGDIFVLPQQARQMSELPLAALGAGLATVAAADSVLDFLIHEQTALLYPDGDHNELAAQLARLLDQRDFALRLARQGQEHVKNHHSVSMMVKAVCQLYDRLTLPNRTIRIHQRR